MLLLKESSVIYAISRPWATKAIRALSRLGLGVRMQYWDHSSSNVSHYISKAPEKDIPGLYQNLFSIFNAQTAVDLNAYLHAVPEAYKTLESVGDTSMIRRADAVSSPHNIDANQRTFTIYVPTMGIDPVIVTIKRGKTAGFDTVSTFDAYYRTDVNQTEAPESIRCVRERVADAFSEVARGLETHEAALKQCTNAIRVLKTGKDSPIQAL